MAIILEFTGAPYSVWLHGLPCISPTLLSYPIQRPLSRQVTIWCIQKWYPSLLWCGKSRHNHGYRGQLRTALSLTSPFSFLQYSQLLPGPVLDRALIFPELPQFIFFNEILPSKEKKFLKWQFQITQGCSYISCPGKPESI